MATYKEPTRMFKGLTRWPWVVKDGTTNVVSNPTIAWEVHKRACGTSH